MWAWLLQTRLHTKVLVGSRICMCPSARRMWHLGDRGGRRQEPDWRNILIFHFRDLDFILITEDVIRKVTLIRFESGLWLLHLSCEDLGFKINDPLGMNIYIRCHKTGFLGGKRLQSKSYKFLLDSIGMK